MKITKQQLRRLIKEEVSALREERQFKLDPAMNILQQRLDIAIEKVEFVYKMVSWVIDHGGAVNLGDADLPAAGDPGAEYEALESEVAQAAQALQRAAGLIESLGKDPADVRRRVTRSGAGTPAQAAGRNFPGLPD